jgi:hypothetical protein
VALPAFERHHVGFGVMPKPMLICPSGEFARLKGPA